MRATCALAAGILMIMTCQSGCGKGSGLEGKVVAGNGVPLGKVKVAAIQQQPVKGYERFETVTGPDGGFKFDKLYPAAAYTVVANADAPGGKPAVNAVSGPKGETRLLTEPIWLRFLFGKDGTTVLDTATGLMWARDGNIQGGAMPWGAAASWVKSISLGGHNDWRLPSKQEFEEFALAGGRINRHERLNSIGFTNVERSWYWTGSELSATTAQFVSMIEASRGGEDRGYKDGAYKVWPVRSAH